MRVDDGEGIALTDGTTNVWGPSWTSDGSLYYVSNAAGSMDLWRQRLRPDGNPDGPPEAITVGIGMHGRAVFSPDGSRVAYSKGGLAANLWRVPILNDRQATWADAEQLTSDQAFVEYLDVSRDGRWVAFSSDRSGNHDIWVMPAEGGQMRQLTTDPTPDWAPAWSPDGTEIAFYAYRAGSRDIWVMPVEAGPARQLTTHPANDWGPRWSPDGKQITFYSSRTLPPEVWIISADGGEPRSVAPGGQPDWSPDGRWIAFTRRGEGIWRASLDGRIVEEFVSSSDGVARFAPDGRQIYYLSNTLDNIWSMSLENGSKQQVTDLQGRAGQLCFLALATDGDYLYFTWRQDLGDIWVMDVVQE
jgi:Tol biopolymer transport system component